MNKRLWGTGFGLMTVLLVFAGLPLPTGYAIDTTPPTGSILINSGQTATKTANVLLTLVWADSDSGVSRMRFSNDGSTWSPWEAVESPHAYTLPSGDGYKTVRVQYMDKAMNVSPVYNDFIRLDTVAPTGGILINGGAYFTESRDVTLTLSWADAGSGVTRMRFSTNGYTWTAWESPKPTRSITLPAGPGHKTIRVQYSDAAQNYSPVYNDYIRLIVHVPNVVLSPTIGQADAKKIIEDEGLVVGAVTYQYHPMAPKDTVIHQTPSAGTLATPETIVGFTLSKGPEVFFALPRTGPAPLKTTFKFADPVTATKASGWEWDFDSDGVVDSTEAEPCFVYQKQGNYTVTLKVTTDKTDTFIQTDYIEAREPLPAVVHAGVFVVDNEFLYQFVSKTADQLVLSYGGSLPSELVVGDIVVGSHEGGYAREITDISISPNGAIITLSTKDAPLNAVFQDAEMSCPAQFTPEEMKAAGFQMVDGVGPTIMLEDFPLDGEVSINGKLTFDPSVDFDLQLRNWELQCFRLAFGGSMNLELEGKLAITAGSTLEMEKSILPKKIEKWSCIWIGWVPVILKSELDVLVGASVEVEGDVGVTAKYTNATTVRFGAEYIKPNWSGINSFEQETIIEGPTFELAGSGEAKLYLKLAASTKICDQVGPEVSLAAYLKGEIEYSLFPQSCELGLSAGLEAGLEFTLAELEWLGFKVKYETSFDIPFTEFNGPWSCDPTATTKAVPAFEATPITGIRPLTVQFTDKSTGGEGGTITNWTWDFGDNETSNAPSPPPHTYATPGTYTVSLKVDGSNGQVTWPATTNIVVLAPPKPVANFKVLPASGPTPLFAKFEDQSMSGPDPITSWQWDLDGDGTVDSTEPNPIHVYPAKGSYNVSLTVTNANGTDTLSRQGIIVAEDPGNPGNGEIITLPGGVNLEMLWVPGGAFQMGSDPNDPDDPDSYSDQYPQHGVTLNGFWMAKYELTKRQWLALMNTTPPWPAEYPENLDTPAVCVSWLETQTFLNALNTHTGLHFRLPSESEWEYACRGTMPTAFYWGKDVDHTAINEFAWHSGNQPNAPYASMAGLLYPNFFGLYDMSGNVWEWCQDVYSTTYLGAPTDGSANESSQSPYRVIRGGTWYRPYYCCRSAYRTCNYPNVKYNTIGFRVARSN